MISHQRLKPVLCLIWPGRRVYLGLSVEISQTGLTPLQQYAVVSEPTAVCLSWEDD